ncbi:MAG: Gfo/Idh/MocA family oxidoreductase [Lachnospiraceae bacterium]|nr:Gfo/Idh/MocA family oxidoreductase [Lachnospiraceae bacterium]
MFCEDLKQANELKQKYQLNEAYDNLDEFMDGLNAVIVNVKTKKAVEYIKKAQKAGKHVLYRFFEQPTLKQIQSMIDTAKKKHLLLLDCMVPVYSQAFNQLMWMVECGRIGKVIHADCIVSNTDDSQLNKYYSVLYAVYVASRICASTDFKYTTFKHKFSDDKYYLRASLESKGVLIDLEIGEGIDLLPNIKILGEEGQIVVPNDWWNTGYFEIYHNGNPVPERHCYNYEGNGMRYILREALIMLREDNYETTRFSNEYAMALYQACKNITEKVK